MYIVDEFDLEEPDPWGEGANPWEPPTIKAKQYNNPEQIMAREYLSERKVNMMNNNMGYQQPQVNYGYQQAPMPVNNMSYQQRRPMGQNETIVNQLSQLIATSKALEKGEQPPMYNNNNNQYQQPMNQGYVNPNTVASTGFGGMTPQNIPQTPYQAPQPQGTLCVQSVYRRSDGTFDTTYTDSQGFSVRPDQAIPINNPYYNKNAINVNAYDPENIFQIRAVQAMNGHTVYRYTPDPVNHPSISRWYFDDAIDLNTAMWLSPDIQSIGGPQYITPYDADKVPDFDDKSCQRTGKVNDHLLESFAKKWMEDHHDKVLGELRAKYPQVEAYHKQNAVTSDSTQSLLQQNTVALQQAENTINDLKEKLEQASQTINDQNKTLTDMKQLLLQVKQQNAEYFNELQKLREENMMKTKLIETQKKEIEDLKAQLAVKPATNVSNNDAEIKELRDEVARLKEELAKRTEVVVYTEEDMDELRNEIAELKADNEFLNKELQKKDNNPKKHKKNKHTIESTFIPTKGKGGNIEYRAGSTPNSWAAQHPDDPKAKELTEEEYRQLPEELQLLYLIRHGHRRSMTIPGHEFYEFAAKWAKNRTPEQQAAIVAQY